MKKYFSPHLNIQFSTSLYTKVGWIGFGFLFILAALFWKERAICMDVAFQTFWLINEGTFQVQVNRFGVVLVQWLPLLAIKLNASISIILLLYSLSFVFLQLVIYYILTKVLKNEYLALLMVFLFTAQVGGSFYWTISEYQQALSLLLVFFGLIIHNKEKQNPYFLVLTIPLIVTLVFYHPLMFYMFGFMWAFFYLHDTNIRSRRYYLYAGVMLMTYAIKSVFFKNWYDTAKQTYLKANFEEYYPAFWKMDSNNQFWDHCVNTWFFFPILFMGVLGYYIYKKEVLKFGLVLGGTLVYLFFVNLTHATGAEYFYLESFYFPMTLFVMLPIIYEFGMDWHMHKNVQIGIVIFILFRLGMIAHGHQYFENRLDKVRNLVSFSEQYSSQKVMVLESEMGDRNLEMNWAVPFETMLCSMVDQRPKQQTLFIYNQLSDKQFSQKDNPDVLLYMNKYFEQSKLNSKYFIFDKQKYKEHIK